MSEALFDPETGEIRQDVDQCPHCASALAEANQAEFDLREAERELRRERRVSAALRQELNRRLADSPNRQAAEALFRYWAQRLEKDGRVVFGEKRRKAVMARLNEYDAAYIARAIDGFAESFYTAPNGKRFDDLELLCRDETRVEQAHDLAERIKAKTLVGPAWLREFGSDLPDEPSSTVPDAIF